MLSNFKKQIMQCKKCPLLVESRKTIVSGYGDPNAEILFIGLAPGRNGADITGIPFTRDPSGVLFQEALIKAGFSLETNPKTEKPKLKNVYMTNIVKCNPKDNNGNNREPFKDEIKACIPYLEKEEQLIKPQIIVPLGKIVTEYVLEKKFNGFIQLHNKSIVQNDIVYVPFIHPSYVIRGAYDREKYIQDIKSLIQYTI